MFYLESVYPIPNRFSLSEASPNMAVSTPIYFFHQKGLSQVSITTLTLSLHSVAQNLVLGNSQPESGI